MVAPHAGHTVVSGGTLTRIDVDKKIRVLRLCITDALADIKHFNGQSIAARTAAALFRNGDPSEMTYSEAVARASQSVDRTPIVNVAAPQVDVHMPERRPQSITATKLPDGSLQATVREAAA